MVESPFVSNSTDASPSALRPGERFELELQPMPPPRIVGPGRRERDYLSRLTRLQDTLAYERERQRLIQTELELSQRVERGAQRRLDRLEERLELSQQRERRLSAIVGALQRDRELLAARVNELEAVVAALPAPATERRPRGFWSKLFGASDEPHSRADRKAGSSRERL